MTRHVQDGETIDLPDYKGVDYLHVQKKHKGGAPDFTGTVPAKVAKCLREDRCGACGLAIPGESIYFIAEHTAMRGRAAPFGTTGAFDIRLYEPPLHRFCARLAGRLCPVLRKQERGIPVIITVPKGQVSIIPRRGGFGGWHYPASVAHVEVIPKRAGPDAQGGN